VLGAGAGVVFGGGATRFFPEGLQAQEAGALDGFIQQANSHKGSDLPLSACAGWITRNGMLMTNAIRFQRMVASYCCGEAIQIVFGGWAAAPHHRWSSLIML
jgi:hypothetical protein